MLKDDFKQGVSRRSLKAEWLNNVAGALNSLTVTFVDANEPLRIEKPKNPSLQNPWRIKIPLLGTGSALMPDRWGRIIQKPFGTGDGEQSGVNVGDPCLFQYKEKWSSLLGQYVEQEPPVFVAKLQGGAGLPDGLIIPGSVYVETNTNHLVQGWLRWNATKGAFEEQMDSEGVPTKQHVAYINASFGPLDWEQGADGWQLVQRLGYVSPNVVAGATWQQGDYNFTSSLPSISFAAAHNPELTE